MSDNKEPGDILREYERLYLEGLWNNSDELYKKRIVAHIDALEKSVQKIQPRLLIEHQKFRQ